MVGVPRSKGCHLCVKRRVKCDQARPACGNCVKYRVECPGYDKTHKFVDGKHAVRTRRGAQDRELLPPFETRRDFSSSSVVPPETPAGQTLLLSQGDEDATTAASAMVATAAAASELGSYPHQRDRSGGHAWQPTLPAAPHEDTVPLVYSLMGQLFTLQAREEVGFCKFVFFSYFFFFFPAGTLRGIIIIIIIIIIIAVVVGCPLTQNFLTAAPWFTSILGHIGKVPLLDTAIMALAMQLMGRSKGDAVALCRSRETYGRALAILQKTLNHPVAWRSTETLAATIICCIFELFAGTQDPLTWMLHAAGVGKLVQQRGPASFSSSSFDRALLRSIRPVLISKSIFAGENCFLDRPKWRRLSSSLTKDSQHNQVQASPGPPGMSSFLSHPSAFGSIAYHDPYFVLSAEIPGVVRVGYNVRRSRKRGIEPDQDQIDELRPKCQRLRADFLAWFEQTQAIGALADPIDVPSADPASPFHTVLRFRNPWEGAMVLAYWANLLILQECLNQCEAGPERPFEASNRRLATDILRCTEHVGHGVMGPYRVGYGLRIAYDFVDRPTQLWTLMMVDKYNKRYEALSRDVYPENPLIRDEDGGGDPHQPDQGNLLSWA